MVPYSDSIAGLYGMAGDINASGDDVKKLDVISNDIMVSALLDSHSCAVLVSEENAEPVLRPDYHAAAAAATTTNINATAHVHAHAHVPPPSSSTMRASTHAARARTRTHA